MIFISHNSKDKALVEPIAIKLAAIYGHGKVFYDSWSIQPGDGIIDKMNEGLENCDFFFFFVSKNSLQSKMVKLEWQNALIKATQCNVKIIPVKIDDCFMPAILLQSLYIDIFGLGMDVGLRQMVDVINGQNTFRTYSGFENIRAIVTWKSTSCCTVEFYTEYYLEPNARFLILHHNTNGELSFKCMSDGMCISGDHENIKLSDGCIYNAHLTYPQRGITPGFPYTVEISANSDAKILFEGLLRAKTADEYVTLPYSEVK